MKIPWEEHFFNYKLSTLFCTIFKECPSGSYGRTCYRQCGNCLNQGSCDHISGVCHGGCLSGWTGDRCDQGESKAENSILSIHFKLN